MIWKTFQNVGNGREVARRLGIHEQTVYQVLRRFRGTCRSCPNKIAAGRVYCPSCAEHLAKRMAQKRLLNRRKGRCIQCRKRRTPISRRFCAEHRLQEIERTVARREIVRQSRNVAGGGLPNVRQREQSVRERYGEAGLAVWHRLNGSCVICGVNYREKTVHIHHVDGNDQNGEESNLTCLCFYCHQLVHRLVAHPNPQAALAWIVSTYPALRLDQTHD